MEATTQSNKAYFDDLKSVLAGGCHYNFHTSGAETPRFFKHGEGSYLWDIEGNKYLDLNGKFGVMILGHNHPSYNEKVGAQLNKVLCANQTDNDLEACELLKKHFGSMEMIRFGLSGTEIIQNALRVSRAYTGKNKFLKFEGHYHGNMDNILGGKYNGASPPTPLDVSSSPHSTMGRAANIVENECYLIPWNDIELLQETLNHYGHEIAAMIMEPVMINGGGVAPKEGYLQRVREFCDQHNIVLIFDEIITGLRFGLSGAQGHYGVTPDLTVLGKSIGGGVPVSAMGGKKEIMQLYASREVIHGGTFNGHPLGMAAIRSVFGILEGEHSSFYENIKKYAEEIKSIMETTAAENGLDLNVSIFGSALVFNCCSEPFGQSHELTTDIVIKNSFVFTQLAKFGILLCPMNRIFLNASFDDTDLEFFRENATKGIQLAARLIDKIYSRNLVEYMKVGF